MSSEPSRRDLELYLSAASRERPAAVFDRQLLSPSRGLSGAQVGRLVSLCRLEAKLDPHQLSRWANDLSWASSALEGNTYTHLEAQNLLEWGAANPAKAPDEAQMILNHKRAIDSLMKLIGGPLSVDSLRDIHRALADGGELTDSRHFLEPERLGLVREYGDVVIAGSSYFPPCNLGPEMVHLLEGVLQASAELDPFNGAMYLLTRLPYLQPFFDANKRTSRLVANIPLLSAHMAPISFVGIGRSDYLNGMIAFYELGNESLLREAFVRAYAVGALEYRLTNQDQRISWVRDRAQLISELERYVLDGERPEHEMLRSLMNSPRPDGPRPAQPAPAPSVVPRQ